jgi:hypothetical protein
MFNQHKLPMLRLEDNAKIVTREVGEG